MKNKLIITLVLLTLSSLFVGVPIKGWVFLYEFEFNLFYPKFLTGEKIYLILKLIILPVHILIILLPLLIGNKNFRILLYLLPPLFVLAFSLMSGLIFIILIPFIIIWIISLASAQNYFRNMHQI